MNCSPLFLHVAVWHGVNMACYHQPRLLVSFWSSDSDLSFLAVSRAIPPKFALFSVAMVLSMEQFVGDAFCLASRLIYFFPLASFNRFSLCVRRFIYIRSIPWQWLMKCVRSTDGWRKMWRQAGERHFILMILCRFFSPSRINLFFFSWHLLYLPCQASHCHFITFVYAWLEIIKRRKFAGRRRTVISCCRQSRYLFVDDWTDQIQPTNGFAASKSAFSMERFRISRSTVSH